MINKLCFDRYYTAMKINEITSLSVIGRTGTFIAIKGCCQASIRTVELCITLKMSMCLSTQKPAQVS